MLTMGSLHLSHGIACFEVLSPYDNEHDDMLHRHGLEEESPGAEIWVELPREARELGSQKVG